MSKKNNKPDLEGKSYSDDAELFDSIFREVINADTSDTTKVRSGSLNKVSAEKTKLSAVHPTSNERMEKDNKESTEARKTPAKDSSILKSEDKDIAVRFWNYLKKDSKETFLDADIKDVNRAVLNFLSQDIAGRKIVLLEDKKLRTANVVARVLKRNRRIIKTDKKIPYCSNKKDLQIS